MNSKLQSTFMLIISLTFSLNYLSTASQAKPPKVFSVTRDNVAPPAELQGRGVKRIRPVVLYTRLFREANAPQTTNMNFFPGIDLIVNWTTVERTNPPPGLIWTGKVQGATETQATLLISGKTVTAN